MVDFLISIAGLLIYLALAAFIAYLIAGYRIKQAASQKKKAE